MSNHFLYWSVFSLKRQRKKYEPYVYKTPLLSLLSSQAGFWFIITHHPVWASWAVDRGKAVQEAMQEAFHYNWQPCLMEGWVFSCVLNEGISWNISYSLSLRWNVDCVTGSWKKANILLWNGCEMVSHMLEISKCLCCGFWGALSCVYCRVTAAWVTPRRQPCDFPTSRHNMPFSAFNSSHNLA